MDAEIENIGRICGECQENGNYLQKAPLHYWLFPERPWDRLHWQFMVDCCNNIDYKVNIYLMEYQVTALAATNPAPSQLLLEVHYVLVKI